MVKNVFYKRKLSNILFAPFPHIFKDLPTDLFPFLDGYIVFDEPTVSTNYLIIYLGLIFHFRQNSKKKRITSQAQVLEVVGSWSKSKLILTI